MKRKSIAMLAAALCTLAITVTALAAELINAEQARSIAAQWVPAGSTHLVTNDESFEFVPIMTLNSMIIKPIPPMK